MSNSATLQTQIVSEVYSQPQTLIELLRSRTHQQSDRLAYTFLVDEGVVETTLTYWELDQRARGIAARLQSIVEVGDRVLLLYPPGLEYIAAFFGCLYAGAIAVPAYPPRNNRNLHRLQTLVQNAEAVVALTTSTILSRIAPHVSQNSYLARLVWQATDQIPDWVANDWREPSISGDSLAFLQYTSGSTSAPKGVMVSHQNLLHNERLIQSVFQQTDQSVIVGWLPLYHDMGLIGNVIQPLFVGAPCILMSPTAFLQKPFRWLQAISRYRATTSGGPNFAYDLCVRKINDEQRATLDLSSWQVAFNGAEPVRQETLERFAAAFAPCGFAFEAFRPCYGLAEATLLVSGRTGNEPLVATTVQARALEAGHAIETTSAMDARTLVSCGGALAQDKVVIVDPETLTECAPGAVGEIWVAGPGVAQGYWNDPAETDRTFRAYLPERGEGPFLRTEDLGFLRDGKLFVTGRLKDLIIIRGLNHYPQDIELTVERCHTALRPGCCAAFSVDVAGEERLVIVQEVDQRRQFRAETVIESINEAVAREHELQAHAIVLVTPGTVPKTSSGKIQRFACREAFLRGALGVVAEQRGIEYTPAKLEDELAIPDRYDRHAVELWLRAQVASKLNIDLQQVDVSQPLTRYGLDSLAAIELAHRIENNFDIAVPLTAFLEGASIAELATRVVEQQQVNSGERRHPGGEPSTRTFAPLSVGQRALWFLQQVDPESAAYNLAGALRLLSPLDVPALQRAFQQLVKRHVSLRTTFPARDGEPAVSVHEDVEVDFIVHDSSAWDEAAVSQYLSHEAHRPFDVEAGPLLRIRLLNRSEEQVLLLCLHHIIADQWSLAVLLKELGVLYEAECTGALVTLPELRSQYADYARWQKKLLSGESGEQLLSYWKKQLAGELPNLNLPTDRPYPPVQTYHGASHLFRLNADLTRSLKEVSCARDATLYMTVLSAFQVLLHGYTDQEDILIGSPAAGRSLAEFANVVGYFVNPLVIRADLTGNATFEAVLSRTRQTVLEAFEHQEYPFPLLTERLQPARDASRSPIFQVMFSMQNSPLSSGGGLSALAVGEPGAKLQLGKLHLESLPFEQQSAMFDITLRMAEVEGELLASLQYNTDLFDPSTITRMAEHFQTLLHGIVTDPSQRLSELPLLTRAETCLLADWNQTERDYEQPYCPHELFEQQVERSPEAVALVFEDKQLNYAELNELANQLAKRLRQFGVKPETPIGLCVERSFEMVIGLLGILKAGGAYVPLNPSDPPERLSFMFEDSRAQVLLTQKRFGHLLPASRAHVIYLDEPYSESAGPTTGPSLNVSPENLAYVIYTSGSTGQPKGAMNAHKAIVNRLLWMQEAYGLGPADCVLQKTPFTFDVSVWEFFWPLLVGARLVLARPGGHQDPAYLARLISAEQVTTLHFVPSMLQVFLDEPAVRDCHSLKRVICSGEALPLALQERFFQLCDAELHNLYGPTEAAVDVTFWACERDSERLTVPIGRPIANTQIHLLNRHLRQTPVGVVGELYIGGIAVGRGYCNQPELTSERFIPDPFGAAGARLYKTGDLARYQADGSIEFLGRVDHQVKLRGQRIELGEIEAVLAQHPAVQEAVVVVREYGPGDQLVAYLVPDRRQSETEVVFASDVISENGVSELKQDFERYLRERLPSYMVPSTFVFLDKLPLTSSGKVDRRALPAPKQDRSELAEDFVGPRNEAEQTLAEIWANVLQIEKVGIHDNFFALGGDSILAIQIVARANRAGLDLSPRQLFQYQTVAQLAAVAGTAQRLQAEQIAITGAVPLTPVQHWFFEHDLPNPHHWNQSVLLEMRRAIDPVLLERVFRHLFAHHDALRLRFTCSESVWTQFNAAVEDALPFSVRDLSTLSDCEQEAAVAAVAAELQTSLNISTGPVLRAAYFGFGPDKPGKLLLVIHHLVVDGISWRILLEDLQLAYEQVSRDEVVSLPFKTTSFKAWAKGLSEYALSEVVEQESAYWLTALPQQPGRLPIDFHGGPNTEACARIVSATLSSEETHALLHDVPSAFRSYINELLLAALAWSFSQETEELSLLIDLEGHGREELVAGADISRTVGWFTVIYPVLLKLEKSSTPAAMVALVKEQLRQIPNYGAGYGVARYLRNDNETAARLRALPQPEVSFNYLGQLDSAFANDGLFASARAIESGLRDPQGERRYLLEINASIIDRRLKLNWTYSQNAHHQSTIERLAQNFLKALQAIITGTESREVSHLTPADFPLANLNQSRLAQLCETFGDPEDIYPLTPVQEGLLFHSFYETRSGVYVEQLSLTLRGKLNVSAFERAWQKVVDRHAILRTAFVWENLEHPLQVVSRDVLLRVATEDWRRISASEQAQRFKSFLQADREQNFDLQAAPLMRLVLFRVADDVYRFVWSHHHLLLDGWSLPIVLNEVFTFYEQFSEGRELTLTPAPQYWNFITWLKQQDSTASETFWRQTLAGFSTPTPLTVDRRQEGVSDQSDLYGESLAHLSPATTTALQSFARRHHLTLHTVLQGAWALLLNRYSGADDVVFGTTVSGRPVSLPESQETVGIFINTLPVRIQVPSDGLLPAWLHELQNKQAELSKHEHTPLIQIQGWSAVPRGTPLFESVLSVLNYPITSALQHSPRDLHVEEVSWYEQTHYPLTMQVTPGSELLLKAIYDPQRFDAQTSERILGHFQTLLERIAAQPAARLSTISVLTEAERRQLLYDWNNTQREYPRDSCIHQLFEEQVERTPEAVAVSFGEQEISYRELNSRANQLAHYLRSLGVGPDVCVGLCLERSVDLAVALVAILKAGGAYVPLDPAYPLERLTLMLEDAQIGIIISTEKLMDVLPAHWAQVVCLDTDAELIAGLSEQNVANEVSAENLAYVMYTSGSTGQPKGVSVRHRSVVRLVQETNYLEVSERDVFLQAAPISFDASTLEVWGSLLNGARLVLLEQQRPTLEELGRAISSHGVTVLWLTAGLFHLMVEEQGWALAGVRRLLAGGDVLAGEQVRKHLAQMGAESRLINGYGPTENTTFTCCHTMTRESRWTGTVPIGKPIANTTVYILDQQQRAVPVGVYGEIYAGGDGLARGYLNSPELTAAKFVPHPFSAGGGERLYRTGDVGRWLSDGSIEFLGRVDHQVKLRGFRIELGEIEAVLAQHAAVQEAVVVVKEYGPGDERLVAYVVGEESFESGALRQYLKGVLPEYMVPQVLVQLERLPLTANGKVDRRALPAVEQVREETEIVAAPTPVEEVLVGIWSEVLGVPVGLTDDFFELGGHSLLATQVISRVREAFGVEVALRELFERPTVKELGQSIERELRQGAGVGAPPIERHEGVEELPLSFAQQRLWFIDQLEPGRTFYNVSAAVRLQGSLDKKALEQTLSEVIRRHEVLRTRFDTVGGRAVQVIEAAAPVELEVDELSEWEVAEREARVRELAQEEAATPFDLSRGPLLRMKLLRLGEQEHVVLLTMHHIVIDGWSLGIFIGEIATLYEAFIEDRPSPLPELAIQYADFALWQRAYLQGEVLEQQLQYWREQLAGAATVLQLPTDKPRPAIYSYRGATHKFILPEAVTAPLRKLSQEQGCTVFMTLLASFETLLYRYTEQEDIVVGTAIANRNRSETEDLIGFFVNSLVLRTDLSGNPSFRKLMQRVRETTLGAYVHQDMPFEKLVEELQPERSLSQAPLFQVSFGVQNTPIQTLSLPGLELSQIDFDFDAGRFDLTLWITEYQDELSGVWSYNTDLFEAATIKRMQGHFETILQNVLAQPDMLLSEIEMLTEDEKEQKIFQKRERLESNALVLRTIRRKGINMPPATAAQTELN